MGSARSTTVPSSAIATVRLASEGEMPFAMSRPVMLAGYSRRAPSGKVRATMGLGSSGSLPRTGVGKRGFGAGAFSGVKGRRKPGTSRYDHGLIGAGGNG